MTARCCKGIVPRLQGPNLQQHSSTGRSRRPEHGLGGHDVEGCIPCGMQKRMRGKAARALLRYTRTAVADLQHDEDEMLRGAPAARTALSAALAPNNALGGMHVQHASSPCIMACEPQLPPVQDVLLRRTT